MGHHRTEGSSAGAWRWMRAEMRSEQVNAKYVAQPATASNSADAWPARFGVRVRAGRQLAVVLSQAVRGGRSWPESRNSARGLLRSGKTDSTSGWPAVSSASWVTMDTQEPQLVQ